MRRGDIHNGFVGLHSKQGLVRHHVVAFRNMPAHDLGFGQQPTRSFEQASDTRRVHDGVRALGEFPQNSGRAMHLNAALRAQVPRRNHLPIDRWVHPDTFAMYKAEGLARGFKVVESGPLVRSSYHADHQADTLGGGFGGLINRG